MKVSKQINPVGAFFPEKVGLLHEWQKHHASGHFSPVPFENS